MNPQYPVLHSLNALRVIAEYFVVHVHLSRYFLSPPTPSIVEALVVDLMSFFFVLSGFVATYTHMDSNGFDDKESWLDYIQRRLHKTYPIYFLNSFINLVGMYVTNILNQVTMPGILHYCSIGDLFLVGTWSFCNLIEENVRQGWYLQTLFWLWFIFPLLHRFLMPNLEHYTETKSILIYILSQIPWILVVKYPGLRDSIRCVPLFRLGEFTMGMCAALEVRHRSGGRRAIVLTILLLLNYLLDFFIFQEMPSVCMGRLVDSSVTNWDQFARNVTYSHEAPCIPVWNGFQSKSSIVWFYLIHWIASMEYNNQEVHVLNWNFFRHMSPFSLQLYMTHETIAGILIWIGSYSKYPIWQLDTLVFTTYLLSYSFYCYIQPILDKTWRGKRESHAPQLAPLCSSHAIE